MPLGQHFSRCYNILRSMLQAVARCVMGNVTKSNAIRLLNIRIIMAMSIDYINPTSPTDEICLKYNQFLI